LAGESVRAASDTAESVNRTRVTFEDASEDVLEFAEGSAEAFGIARRAALDGAGTFGAFFANAGVTSRESARLSVDLVKLSADLASFNNVAGGPTEVLAKLRSGLAGEAEPLRQFGIFLSEGAVAAKAVEMGIARAGEELTEGQRVQARYGVILEQSSAASGDFARTSGSLANQQRVAAAKMDDLKAELGEALVPALTAGTETANGLLGAFNSLPQAMQEEIVAMLVVGTVSKVAAVPVKRLWDVFSALDAVALTKAVRTTALVGIAVWTVAGALQENADLAKLGDTFDASRGSLGELQAALDATRAHVRDLQTQSGLWEGLGEAPARLFEHAQDVLGHGLLDELADQTQAVREATAKQADVLDRVREATGLSVPAVKALADRYGVDLTKGTQEAADALVATYTEQSLTTAAEAELDETTKILTDTMAEQTDKVDAYTAALEALSTVTYAVTDAEVTFQASADGVRDLWASLTEATTAADAAHRAEATADLAAAQALDINEATGRDLVGKLGLLARQAATVASETYKQTGSISEATGVYQSHVAQIDGVISELGLDREKVRTLIGEYDKLPPSVTTAVNVVTGKVPEIPRVRPVSPELYGPLGRSVGGDVEARQPYRVGEHGTEVFVPDGRLVAGMSTDADASDGDVVNVYVEGAILETAPGGLARAIREAFPAARVVYKR